MHLYQVGKRLLALSSSAIAGALTILVASASEAKAALLVGNTQGDNVLIFDERSGKLGGEFIPAMPGFYSPDDLTFGPDGNLYVTFATNPNSSSPARGGAILKFDGKTGDFLGRFDNGGSLNRPYGIAFGPDGYLYASSFLSDEIIRYDAVTGDFVDVFATGTGTVNGLNGPNDLLFGKDGTLYVTTQGSVKGSFGVFFESQVLQYDLSNPSSPTVFVAQPTPSPDSFGFVSFLGLAFGPSGDLFVSDFANDIRRYDLFGNLLDTLPTNFTTTAPPSLNFVGNLAFDPNGLLYTVGFDLTKGNQGAILRYDGETGDPLPSLGQGGAVFVPTNPALKRPIGVAYSPIVVPEPGITAGLVGLGVAGLLAKRKRETSV